MRLMNKKGQAMSQLQQFILGIVGVAVVLAIGLIVLTELQSAADDTSKYCTSLYTYNSSGNNCYLTTNASQPTVAIARTEAYTATGSILTKLATVPTWMGIVIVVALAFVVLGIFYLRGQGNY
jgi:hypothetical protein